ncbi:hypothetical protein LLEC1_01509 [Akanthomyces lecanii]|uniref:Carrier domain-containing protein n=1 Tax=Cordyceps confragosa TaxID=2714763 RepID=A0A179II23_CORDF|nr:hypothetical protein LLEC1_01509 [Akanthomyces lecanii]
MGNDDGSTGYDLLRRDTATITSTNNRSEQIESDIAVVNYIAAASIECVWHSTVQHNLSEARISTSKDDDTQARGIASHGVSVTDDQDVLKKMATTIHGAWALVVACKTSSTFATYSFNHAGESFKPATPASSGIVASRPVRIQLLYEQSVSTYLQSVRQQLMNAPSRQDDEREADQAFPHSTRTGKFRTLLILQHGNASAHDSRQLLEGFDLVVRARLSAHKTSISIHFDSRTMEPSVAHACLDRLDHVASQLYRSQDCRSLADVEMITPAELKQLWKWNATVPASVQRCVHTVVEARARDQPTAMAVCAWDGDLTYKMLDELSTALAAQLVNHGVDSDSLVPLCFHKSKWTSVAILAVLKAGGAFVLLDPSLPEQRLQVIVQQLAAKLIVSSESNQPLCSRLVTAERPVVVVGPNSALKSDVRGDLGRPGAQPSSTCYLVFTSGSTGTPKGIMITHENAASAIHHHVQRLELTAETRIFDFASYSTDVSISNLFLVWGAGGCLCVPAESDRNNNPEKSIIDLRANTIDMTPSLARLLSPDSIPRVSLVIFGGEALRLADVQRWWGRARIVHEYGSSECTQNSTMNGKAKSPEEVVRIGTGAGLVTWIVDPANHNILLPPGSVGELLLEGPLVGRGYLNDPDKSAAAFIEPPAWLLRGRKGSTPRSGRLYKSGDLVRYNEDGSLIFVDRKDGQAKVRGQRVDLGEVEHWVRVHIPGATEVVAEVILPRGEHASPTLVVFLRSNRELMDICHCTADTINVVRPPAEVEEKLAQQLPSYMIPTAFLFMDELPKTATGKMHRSRLRESGSAFSVQQLAESRTAKQSLKQQPTSKAEYCMQDIWARVLGIDASKIGLEDSFFHLGGDSIAAMRVVTESRKAGLCITFADIFRHRRLQQVAASAVPSADIASRDIIPRNAGGPIPQTLDQEQIWLKEQSGPGSACYLKPCAVQLRGPLQLPALETALLALEKRHETLRTTFATHGNSHVQEVQPFWPRALSVINLSSEAEGGCSLQDALRRDQTTSFCLGTEHGWRVSVYRCGKDDHVLSLVMHNLIADGWSVGVLSRELTACYAAAIRGQDPFSQLEPLPVQFGDYCTWQRQQVQDVEYQRQLDFWTRYLEKSRPAELLRDLPRPTIPSGRAALQEFKIKNAVYGHLRKFCKERDVTMSVAMFSGIAAVIHHLTGVDDTVIGVACANRERWEVANLVGLFVKLLCVRTKVKNETFDSLVRKVQAATVDAYANQDVPCSEIASKLQSGKGGSGRSLFHMVFAFNNSKDTAGFELEGVESRHLDTVLTTRYDLEFIVNQKEDELQVQIYYAKDLYQRQTISKMIDVFQNILEQGLSDPSVTMA